MRNFIKIKPVDTAKGYLIRIMTYNVRVKFQLQILAQQLIKRDLFPYCVDKETLKWRSRKNKVVDEIISLNPDLACLQEVDFYEEHFKSQFEDLGYTCLYSKSVNKSHGKIKLTFQVVV